MHSGLTWFHRPDSEARGAYMGPTWGRQDPGGSHVGPMNFAIRAIFRVTDSPLAVQRDCGIVCQVSLVFCPMELQFVFLLARWWRRFSASLILYKGIHQSLVNSPHKRLVMWTLMFLWYQLEQTVEIKHSVVNDERRHDVHVMSL